MRIGIFGGTFDPPHIGHLVLASEALDQLNLDRLLWVLTPNPPHKLGQPISPVGTRLAMVQAAIAHEARFEFSRVELDRPGPHYAVDTVCLLQEQFPGAALVYLLGGDSLRDLHLWYQPQQFIERVSEVGVMKRAGVRFDLGELENKLPGLQKKTRFIETPLLEISSSEIRQRIEEGKPYRYFLPVEVFQLIQQNHTYQQPA